MNIIPLKYCELSLVWHWQRVCAEHTREITPFRLLLTVGDYACVVDRLAMRVNWLEAVRISYSIMLSFFMIM